MKKIAAALAVVLFVLLTLTNFPLAQAQSVGSIPLASPVITKAQAQDVSLGTSTASPALILRPVDNANNDISNALDIVFEKAWIGDDQFWVMHGRAPGEPWSSTDFIRLPNEGILEYKSDDGYIAETVFHLFDTDNFVALVWTSNRTKQVWFPDDLQHAGITWALQQYSREVSGSKKFRKLRGDITFAFIQQRWVPEINVTPGTRMRKV
jgi:hypothetical protein